MWRYAAARLTGTAHVAANLSCQDRYGCMALPSGALVVALADGAGSAAKADQGAEIAVDTVMAFLKRSIET